MKLAGSEHIAKTYEAHLKKIDRGKIVRKAYMGIY